MANINIEGMFAHVYNSNRELIYQVEILGKISDGCYFCQYYDFVLGDATDQKVHTVEQMGNWKFYNSETEWHEAYSAYQSKYGFNGN